MTVSLLVSYVGDGGEVEMSNMPGGVGGAGGLEQYMYHMVATWPSGFTQPRPWSVLHQVPPRSLSGLAQPVENTVAPSTMYSQHAMQVQRWTLGAVGGGGGSGFGGGGKPVVWQ